MADIEPRQAMAIGALMLEIWRQGKGQIGHGDAHDLAVAYFEKHPCPPESSQASTDAARELWWLYAYSNGTPVNEGPDARRLEWWRDWRTNPNKKWNIFRAMRKHFVTVFPDSNRPEDWKYVIAPPDGRSIFSDVYYPTLEKACVAAHRALLATVYPELLKELPS